MNRISSVAIAAFLTVSTALPAIAGGCVSSAEARAMQLRQLHIQLQVASLNCRGDDPSLPGKYASYVKRFGGALSDNAKVLRGHFSKTGGNMDRYMTVLANDESQRAHQVEDYCGSHTPLFERLSAVKPTELEHFASATIDGPDVAVCTSSPVKQASATIKTKASVKPAEKKTAQGG